LDSSEKHVIAFERAFTGKPIRFIKMDAEKIEFPDASFDTVSISNSLHHMASLEQVLSEMKRVLRPGGYFIASEMFSDNQAETQMTHVELHHWWAAIDRAQGVSHNETYSHQQLLNILTGLGLIEISVETSCDLSPDPKDPETIKYLVDVTDQYLQRLEGLPGKDVLRIRGMELRQRVEKIGFHSATSLLFIGKFGDAQ
jgi:SAM-dependent methyltransferase